MKGLERFLHYIDVINDKIGQGVAYVLIPLALITIFEVVSRYVFNSPTIWAWDVNLQFFGIVILLGAGYTLLKDRHVKVEAVLMYLPDRARVVIEIIGMLLLLWVAVILVWQGGEWGWESFVRKVKLDTIWAPYIFHIRMLVPVGGALLALQGLAKLIRNIQVLSRGGE